MKWIPDAIGDIGYLQIVEDSNMPKIVKTEGIESPNCHLEIDYDGLGRIIGIEVFG